jgi:glucose-1-phosphate cytidylyltransferase
MKVVILAGGRGTRLAEETETIPKPMVEIGERPILWHILKHFAHFGLSEFLIALGYKGDVIKRYFLDYYHASGDLTLDLGSQRISRADTSIDSWLLHLIETGLQTNTGGRVRRLRSWLCDETFMLTYGDGVSDVDLHELLRFHRGHGKLATVTAVRPPARFGGLVMDGDDVREFTEKPQIGEGWINGGYMVLEPGVLDYLDGDQASLESDALERLAGAGQLVAYRHERFWQCMDTLREKRLLESLWSAGSAPWVMWDCGR